MIRLIARVLGLADTARARKAGAALRFAPRLEVLDGRAMPSPVAAPIASATGGAPGEVTVSNGVVGNGARAEVAVSGGLSGEVFASGGFTINGALQGGVTI